MYVQKRSGWLGQPFFVYKLRIMNVVSATEPARWTEISDQRITPIGRWLRRVRLDELPQLWNVLNGTMSLVGPRPVVREELVRYGRGARFYLVNRPGLTGLWQVSGRNDIDYSRRVALDRAYTENAGFWLDFRIVMRTVWIVLRVKDAY